MARNYERAVEIGMHAESIERRAANRENSAQILERHGVAFDSKNSGAHLVVTHGDRVADFWPGTGKYIPRKFGRPRRGVFNLMKAMGVPVIAGGELIAGKIQ